MFEKFKNAYNCGNVGAVAAVKSVITSEMFGISKLEQRRAQTQADSLQRVPS